MICIDFQAACKSKCIAIPVPEHTPHYVLMEDGGELLINRQKGNMTKERQACFGPNDPYTVEFVPCRYVDQERFSMNGMIYSRLALFRFAMDEDVVFYAPRHFATDPQFYERRQTRGGHPYYTLVMNVFEPGQDSDDYYKTATLSFAPDVPEDRQVLIFTKNGEKTSERFLSPTQLFSEMDYAKPSVFLPELDEEMVLSDIEYDFVVAFIWENTNNMIHLTREEYEALAPEYKGVFSSFAQYNWRGRQILMVQNPEPGKRGPSRLELLEGIHFVIDD